ncbi:cytochrome o ubiquinol oxidase subunit 1 [Endobacter medicaginis]|uniref:Cbb3-type cytochrome c oxidase subunit I n=1 Tax=Endobacter medicaginis TaxID=1181271 RepID=A0A839UZW5_9PROT|nr:cbb3-type cytochrome c oxidase subunit I [Endobacter medicaginis]MBB3173670.1 cytochrome o ubiquinol oxidase subunit 1 [Endobacter medicaginis]MCX5476998.1 cbb3-type cytochrome c oxidase subunit I [Endobacter medicaginis]NVN30011.1 cbb3-type cytochrome c oxidase subunit I [Endobacter medicaginis]
MSLWHALFGKLGYDALPFYSAIATGAASMVVIGALVTVAGLTWFGAWGTLWREWLTSVDHKRIGIMYVVIALVMLSRALIEGCLMRAQQAVAYDQKGFLTPDHFSQLFSTHGTIMIFFMAMPFLIGVINFVMPLQIGARDVSFPVLNSVSLALTAAGAALLMVSLCLGKFSTGGWSGYPPYTEIAYSPGVGVDYWIWALSLSSIGTTMTGLNFAVTIYKKRAPGLTLMRMPLFVWAALCTAILMVFAMPPLTVATSLLALDRYAGAHFFTNGGGGNMMNYVNLFWLFGHPEVYILILPAFGVFSEVFSTFSAKALYGYTSLVIAVMAIAVLSFTVWLHHFFTMGQGADVNSAFGIATMLIGIPTGVKIYDWIATMYRGRVRFSVPLLYALAFLILFAVGGLSGILLANPGVDYQVHNTVFLVAHFHNVIIPGVLFGMLAAYHYWFPKAFGFRLDERWGRISCALWTAGFLLAFMPLYVLGAMGLPRRTVSYTEAAYHPWTLIAAGGAALLFAALASLIIQLVVSIRHRAALAVPAGDPWDGRNLEWSVAAPPPEYNFATLPHVDGIDAFARRKSAHDAYPAPPAYEDIEIPRPSALGPAIGIAGVAAGFGLTWHIWWMAGLGLLLAIGAVIARSFVRETIEVIDAATVAAEDRAWRALLASEPAVDRDAECASANRGLALPEAV